MDELNFYNKSKQQELDLQMWPGFESRGLCQSGELLSVNNNIATGSIVGQIGQFQPAGNCNHSEKTVKEKIQAKLREKGTCFSVPKRKQPEPHKPTPKQEDPATIKKRRERNKIAAMKCRRRKRERILKLQKRRNEVLTQKRRLEEEKRNLQEECNRLLAVLHKHQCKIAPNYHSTPPTTGSDFLDLLGEWGIQQT